MFIENKTAPFESVLYVLSSSLCVRLNAIDKSSKEQCEEIRLRIGKPVSLTVSGKSMFLKNDGTLLNFADQQCVLVTADELEECYKKIVRGSVYSHLNELQNGFVTIRYGHRVGICGSFCESGNISKISSLNIRIARQKIGCASYLYENYFGGGVLIAGPPCSGKTTLLRDFIRLISSGKNGKSLRVAVADTRGELSAPYGNAFFNDLGINTDILVGYKKQTAVLMAVRCLNPQIIAFDEISDCLELAALSEGFYCGADAVLTAHIGKVSELYSRSVTKSLLESGIITTVVLCSNDFSYKILNIKQVKELCGV